VLDTRTRRKFTGEGYKPPDLVGLDREAQVPLGPLPGGREVLFVITATPVLLPDVIDAVGWPAAQLAIDIAHSDGLRAQGTQSQEVGVEKYDAEGWSSNELAREELLKRLATHERVVLLSGDVHFACTMTLDYYRRAPGAPVVEATSRIVQCTSSPARNSFKALVKLLVRQNAYLQAAQTQVAAARLAWNGPSPIAVPAAAFLSPGRRSRLLRSPSLLPAAGWPPDTAFPAARPPDFSWRLALVRDERPDDKRPPGLEQPTLADDLVVDDAAPVADDELLDGYRALARRHQRMALTRFEYLRQVVFQTNIGLVRLKRSASGIEVEHLLISRDRDEPTIGRDGTLHTTSLEPSSEPPPQIEFRPSR